MYVFIMGLCLTLFFSCNKGESSIETTFELNDWIEDRNRFIELQMATEANNCDLAESIRSQYKGSEFKSRSSISLAQCFVKFNKNKALAYLELAFKDGYHIRLIDSTKFSVIWPEIKSNYNLKSKKFWKNRDTTYFKKLEHLVYLDQYVRLKEPAPSVKELKQDSINTEFLLNYCRKKGFPLTYYPSNFEKFRKIDPTILAIHANDNSKIEILQFAINAAQEQRISWLLPLVILKSYYVAGKVPNSENSLLLLNFNKNGDLNYEKSFLQLYALKELYIDEVPSIITISPSFKNNSETLLIQDQLSQIKKALVEKLNFDNAQVIIKNEKNLNEKSETKIGDFHYIISASKL